MNILWHRIAFTHSCGLQGTILEVCVSRDGGIMFSGLCVTCGREFSIEDNFANLICKSAIQDYLRHKSQQPDDILANATIVGKPN